MINFKKNITTVTESANDPVTPESIKTHDFTKVVSICNPVTSETTAEQEMMANMRETGVLPEDVELEGPEDNGVERFQTEGDERGKKSGWVIRHYDDDGVLRAASYGDWRNQEENRQWQSNGMSALPDAERAVIQDGINRARRAAQEARQQEQEDTARRLEASIAGLSDATEHPYLQRKEISATAGVKEHNGALVVPLRNIDGKLMTAQYIQEDGSKRLAYGCSKKGAFYQIDGEGDVLLIAEGYATAVSLYEATGYTTVMAIDCGNLAHVAHAFRDSKYAVVVCGDNDQYTEGNPGLSKAKEAAKIANGLVVVPEFQSEEGRPTDFNDLATREGQNEVKTQVQLVSESALLKVPGEYKITERGVYLIKNDLQEKLCSPLKVLAMTRDRQSRSWGRYLELVDSDGVKHRVAVSAELIMTPKDLVSMLVKYGLTLSPSKISDIATYINECKPVRRAICTEKVGWKEQSFILPDGMIGESNDLIVVQSRGQLQNIFEASGSLEDWQRNVSALCPGNSRMILAVSMAFAAPLLEMIGEESGGVHLRCGSSRGKTTSLRLGKSVWGSPDSIQMWRATDNGLESLASLHNNSLLCLDELGQIDPRKAGDAVYMLGNGKGKQRADSSAEAREVKAWNLLFLSTGELSLREVMDKGGAVTYAGQEVRFIDLPADTGSGYGLFDTIHDRANAADFANDVNKYSKRYYGTAGRAFLEVVTERYEECANDVRELVEEFVVSLGIEEADPQVKRVARRFGIIFAGGFLATDYGITGWNAQDIAEPIKQCFNEWLEERGGDGSLEEARTLEEIKRRLRRASNLFGDGESVLPASWNRGQEPWGHRLNGYYHLFVPAFKEDLCDGLAISQVVSVLDSAGFLLKGSRYDTRSQRILGKTHKVYSISERILEEPVDEQEDDEGEGE